MIVFSLSAVSAGDNQATDSGQVSGDVDVVTVNPWNTTGELTYDIPSDAKEIKSADVYVNVYSGSAQNTYGANANVSLKTVNGENQIASEVLWIEDGTTDGTIYEVNNHTNKCYSDFQMHYDITDYVNGLQDSPIVIKVDTFKMENKSFDGRIKLIALILAYDDGDEDVINYWVDTTQKWTKTNITTVFDTANIGNVLYADLYNVALSSGDGTYKVNGEFLDDAINHTSGDYYQYNYWDVSDKLKKGQNTELTSYPGASSFGSIKNVLTLLKAKDLVVDVSIATEYTSVPSCYAGTNNTLTVTVKSNKAGNYTVELLADGVVVDSSELELDEAVSKSLLLTDQTIRPIDGTTVSGAENAKVVYSVNVKLKDDVVGDKNVTLPVLYNGYLSKEFAYNATGYEADAFTFTGDIVIEIKGESSYKSGATGVNEIWTVEHDDIERAYIYVPYNWFNAKTYVENETMFNVMFNNVPVEPVGFYRDQGNLGNYGKYGYGVLIYDVTDFIKAGDNTFNLTKVNPTPTVYPTVLFYAYNSPDSNITKIAYVNDGADVLANDYNNAGRIVKLDTEIDIDPFVNATLYVLAASAQKGEGNIIVNGEAFEDVWSGTTKTTDLFTVDISDIAIGFNEISFVATGSTILALPQIIVTTPIVVDVSTKTEYTSVPTCYAGTNNTLTVALNSNKAATYLVELYADGFLVATHEVELDANVAKTILITDPTIRPINETTVSGADNDYVQYDVIVKYEYAQVGADYLTLPVLYNGYLSKDFAYNATGYGAIEPITFTGDIVIDIKNESSYASGAAGVNEIWTVGHDNIAKAYVYVPYNWFNGKLYVENETMFNVAFNGVNITPVAYYRDQANMGNYGKYGYGILIYDVTDIIKTGDNTFNLTKVNPTPTVYPTALVYAYNTPASGVVKTAYIINGADLLANDYNNAGRVVMLNSQINVSMTDVTAATLYVFAASAQPGEGNVIVNGAAFNNVWNGTTKTTDLYAVDITGVSKESNDISFVATGSTILSLPQMIVTTKTVPIDTVVTPKALSTTYDSGKAFTVTVVDAAKKPVNGLKLTLKVFTGKAYAIYYATTNANGVASFASASKLAIGTHNVEITSDNKKYNVAKTTSSIKVAKAKTTVKAPKVTAKVKKSKYFKVTVKNKATKKVVKNIKVKIKVYTGKKYKIYKVKTSSKGIAKINTKSLKVGKHKVVITSGNSKYTISKKSTIVIKK